MRKKCLLFLIIYLVTFIPGAYLQTLKGIVFNDVLWRQTEPNRFELSSDSYLAVDGEQFDLSLNQRRYAGTHSISPDGESVFSFDDGWSLIYPVDPHRIEISFSTGQYLSGGDGRIRIDDLSKLPLHFMAAGETERYPIYDSNGYTVGESVHVKGIDGETTLLYTEEWFNQPEFGTPEAKEWVLSDGVELDAYMPDHYVLLNEEGEYLLNRDDLFYIPHNGRYISKAFFGSFIERAMNQQIVQRGSLWFVVLSTVIYLFGACSFLYARQFALWGQRWKYTTDIEPSDAYIFVQKVAGAIVMVAAILLLYIPLQ